MKSYNRAAIAQELQSNGYEKLWQYYDYGPGDLIAVWEAGYRKALADAREHLKGELRKIYDNL
jgi:hypothetical protein